MIDRCGCNHLESQHDGGCHECLCPEFHTDARLADCLVHDRWPLKLPEHRAYRTDWAWWEAARICAMYHHLRPGHILYDVGAEEGDLSALWASLGCKVVACEPNPKAWPSLKASFEANGLHPLAWWVGLLSDRVWTVDDEKRLGGVGWPACADDGLVPDHGFFSIWEHHEVAPALTLDELVSRTGLIPDAVTIDVEGGELHVLRGARRTLEEHRPMVFCSVHRQFMADSYGLDADDLFDLMADLGYRATYLATDHEEHWLFKVAA